MLLKPSAEPSQSFVRARNYLHAHNLADLGSGRGSGIGCGFHRSDVAAEKPSHVAAAYLFPADERDVGRFEGRIAGFQQGAQSFAFDHSNCLLGHKLVDG